MRIFQFLVWMMLFMTSLQAMSIKLDGSGGLISGTDCQTGSKYRFGTENSYNGQALDLLVEVVGADNDYADTHECTYVMDKTLATNLRDKDADDNIAFEEYQITLVKKGTDTPVEVDRLMITGYDLDTNVDSNSSMQTGSDDFYVAADGAYISSGSSVNHTTGNFFGSYTDYLKGYTEDNCDDSAATPDVMCRASAIWVNGNGMNKVSSVRVRVQNDNAYGEFPTDNNSAYRLIQLSFQIEDFASIFNGEKDHGDAPTSYGEAAGKLDGTIMLGSGFPADPETAYQGDDTAQLDDTTHVTDEGAVSIGGASLSGKSFRPGDVKTFDILTYGSGYLQLWIDYNRDGDFEDSGEHVISDLAVNNNGESLNGVTQTDASSGVSHTAVDITTPSTVALGKSFVRVRFSAGNSAAEKDPRSSLDLAGEVEDYAITFVSEGSIFGSVKDTNNNALPNIKISLMEETAEIASVLTDANGEYQFLNIPVGDYTIVNMDTVATSILDGDSSDDNDTQTNSNTSDKSIPITLLSAEEDRDNNFVHTLSESISGKVTDSSNRPLANASLQLLLSDGVTVAKDNSNVDVAPVLSNAAGEFIFINIPTGDYLIKETNPPHYISISESAGDDDVTGDNTNDDLLPVTLESGEKDSDNLFVDQVETGSILGSVKDEDGVGIEGTHLSIMIGGVVAKDVNGSDLTTITDASGNYSFSGVPYGEYMIVESDLAGYTSISDADNSADGDTSSNDNTNDNTIPVSITADKVDADNDFVDRRPGGTISGQVQDKDGQPLANAKIELHLPDGSVASDTTSTPFARITTDASGNFSFANVPAGDYVLMEVDAPYYSSVRDDAGDDNANNSDMTDNMIPVTLASMEIDNDNIFVDEGLKKIHGTVELDVDGDKSADRGFADVIVHLSTCTGEDIDTTTSDSNGSFVFSNLVDGCYILTERDPIGYTSVSDIDGMNDNNITVTLSGVDVEGQEFLDAPLVTVSGWVRADMDFDGDVEVDTSDDKVLEGVEVSLFKEDEKIASVVTDANGDYRFEHVIAGVYRIVETDPEGFDSLSDSDGANDNTIMITVAEEAITDKNFEDQRTVLVSGTIRVDVDGDNIVDEPLQDTQLLLCMENTACTEHTSIAQTYTDENGTYEFSGLKPGNYQIVEIDDQGYESLDDVDGANDNTIVVHINGTEDILHQDFNDLAVAPNFIKIRKATAKREVGVGGFVPYSIRIENDNISYSYAAVKIKDILPAGFRYVKGSARLLRGTAKSPIVAAGKKSVEFGEFALKAKEVVTLTYLTKVGVAVAKGEHTNTAVAIQNDKEVSNISTATVSVVADPFIDNSLVIGKVFEDANENGVQDKGEKGIPGVRLATVDGMLIETDGYGRYHIADTDSGGFNGRGANFIVKVDPTTIPKGARFTTENPRVYRITSGQLNVIDFGVKLPKAQRLSKEQVITKVTMKTKQVEVSKEVKIGSIYFDSDQDCIRPDQVKSLCKIADKIKSYGHGSIMIEGNTDARAPMWYNRKLAYKRAQSVYSELRHYLGDRLVKHVEVVYDNCGHEVAFDPRYDWWGKPNIPRTKKECTQFGLSKKECHSALKNKKGGAL